MLPYLKNQTWRLNNLYWIKDKQGKKVRFRLNWAQTKLLADMHYFNVILKARQLGFTTFSLIYFLDCCLFQDNHSAGVIAHTQDDAGELFDNKVKFAYNNLPDEIKEYCGATQDSAKKLEFTNGSSFTVGTSLRSGTYQKLLISEYGKVSAKYPEKAREIKTGALNTVEAGQQIFVESTAEGKTGEFFDLCEQARANANSGKQLGRLDPKFHFFAWFDNPEYALPDIETQNEVIPQETLVYLAKFPQLTQNQKAWYAVKEKTMGEDMRREFPSTPEEAFEGSLEGAYYSKEMAMVRQAGQITTVPYNSAYPVNTYWDIGQGSDQMSIIYYQEINNRHNIINYHESSNEGWAFYANLMRSMNYNYGKHYFPHDGNKKIIGTEVFTTKQLAQQVGITPIEVVQVTKSVHLDIMNHCKPMLPNIWFDESKCALLISRIDNYTRRWDRINGMWLNEPKHDEASHGADSLRTLVMAKNKESKEVAAEFVAPGTYTSTSYARRH